MRTDTPKAVYLKDYAPPPYLVRHADLTVRIFEGRTVVTAKLEMAKNHPGREALFLNGEKLKLLSCRLNGKETSPEVSDRGLTLSCPGDKFTLEIETEIDPATNTALEGLYLSGGTYCTQCEAEGFRKITYYTDRPDVMATFRVRVEADKESCPVLLSNGNLIDGGNMDGGRHYAVWDDPTPKPCYLFALVAGDLVHIQDYFTTRSGRKVDLRIYVRKGDESQCAHAMDSLIRSMKWDEDVYGREYQYDRFNIVAVSDFNMGAMENTSLNIFNTALVLAHPDTATDVDFERVESVIAHEYFHNWTGNRITCRDWFQLSLKEGLTVFRDQEFSADMNSRDVERIEEVIQLRRMQFPEDAGPLAHPVRPDNYIEINNFYTLTVYEKGAEVIRMMRTLLGHGTYRKATDLYFDRFDGQAVTCEDFAKCMEDASGLDLTQFRLWYTQAGTPEVEAETAYDEHARTFTLTLRQSVPPTPGQPVKKPMHIPVAVGLVGPNGDDMIETRVLDLRESEQKFTFENIGTRPVPSILRNFSAPVKLTTDLSGDDLRFLMVHDSDGFNRWEAGQTLALRVLGDMISALENGEDAVSDEGLIDSFALLAQQALNKGADKALLARALSLPDIPLIAQSRDVVDPGVIYAARKQMMAAIGQRALESFKSIYEGNAETGAFSASAEAMARRALKNVALRYLKEADEKTGIKLAETQYHTATTMTDRVAALSILAETVSAAREKAFADFYERFKSYPLVIDKWFSLQAAAIREDTLAQLQTLRIHPDFIMRNPNRARSLFGAFAMNNPVCFHASDGGGYEFLKQAVIEMNAINPQIAARLLTPLREWRRYTPDRQEKMKAALQEIAALPKLSPDVFEIVSKSLN